MKTLLLFLIIGLGGCSSKSDSRLPGCNPSSSLAILCLGSVIATAVDSDSSQKCSAKSGEQKKSCDAQVDTLKKHISEASKK